MIGSSFYPAVLINDKSESSSLSLEKENIESISNALLSFGFERDNDAVVPIFKVTFLASTSYVIELRLDNKLDLKSMRQKPLVLLHGTILGQELSNPAPKIPSCCHLRVKLHVCVAEEVTKDSDLYYIPYPENQHNNDDTAPIEIGQDGFARPAAQLPAKSCERLSHIRQVNSQQKFKRGNLIATISTGANITYKNRVLVDIKPFTEVSLYENVDHLWDSSYTSSIEPWITETIETSLKIQKFLKTILNKQM
jgi:hypothetical protein